MWYIFLFRSKHRWWYRLQPAEEREHWRSDPGDTGSIWAARRRRCLHQHQVHGSHIRILPPEITRVPASFHLWALHPLTHAHNNEQYVYATLVHFVYTLLIVRMRIIASAYCPWTARDGEGSCKARETLEVAAATEGAYKTHFNCGGSDQRATVHRGQREGAEDSVSF